MLDWNALRNQTEGLRLKLAERGVANEIFDDLMACDQLWRQKKSDLESHVAQVKIREKAIASFGSHTEDAKTQRDEALKTLKHDRHQIDALRHEVDALETKRHSLFSALPNIAHESVPIGDEENNMLIESWSPHNTLPEKQKWLQSYDEIAKRYGYEAQKAAQISGARFALFRGPLARLERALGMWLCNVHRKKGYEEVSVPFIVRDHAAYGVGQLPKFGEDLFRFDGYNLISTGEVPLTNIVREETLNASELPLRFTTLSPCFRSEAGSAGRDTQGFFRVHQFLKVELVHISTAEQAQHEYSFMMQQVRFVLEALGLPYRIVRLATRDMGQAAHITHDFEAWFAHQQRYREISSCSWCHTYQAQRMEAKYQDAQGRKQFVHTFNGSALPLGRVIAALLEHYQREDGRVEIPSVLRSYMGQDYL